MSLDNSEALLSYQLNQSVLHEPMPTGASRNRTILERRGATRPLTASLEGLDQLEGYASLEVSDLLQGFGMEEESHSTKEEMHCEGRASVTPSQQSGSDDSHERTQAKVFPRRKAGQSSCGRQSGKDALVVEFDDLVPFFKVSQREACAELGIGLSTMKRLCRKFGIKRWPGSILSPSDAFSWISPEGEKDLASAPLSACTRSGAAPLSRHKLAATLHRRLNKSASQEEHRINASKGSPESMERSSPSASEPNVSASDPESLSANAGPASLSTSNRSALTPMVDPRSIIEKDGEVAMSLDSGVSATASSSSASFANQAPKVSRSEKLIAVPSCILQAEDLGEQGASADMFLDLEFTEAPPKASPLEKGLNVFKTPLQSEAWLGESNGEWLS
mmetsp:Transcript_36051/g.74130  ORF Transcript_36051/g.74130 Transcript_36051/m.74130 type:complete len:391 (+) Transcript_36051:174-1346(+)